MTLPAMFFLILIWLVSKYVFPHVHRGLLLAIAMALAGILEPFIWWICKPKSTGSSSDYPGTMIGQLAEVIQDLAPTGVIKIHGELWNASSNDGTTIKAGESVFVQSINGLHLIVKRS